MFEEQRSHNECALKLLLLDVRSGAYPLRMQPGDVYSEKLQGAFCFTAVELFGFLKRYMMDTGAQSSVDSVMALGHAMSKNFAKLAPKVPGRVAKYKVHVAVETGV